MKISVLNDLHIGVNRTGGTTSESASALRDYVHDMYEGLLAIAGEYVVVNGDMFDAYQVPTLDVLLAYQATVTWLESTGKKLWLVPGNHDLAKNSANLSSFEFMARLLEARYPDKVKYLYGSNWVDEASGLFAISHLPNQDQFDYALANLPEGVKTLLLHCNFDNVFAGQSDHSLNIDRSVARDLTKKGITLVLGHEHQGRTLLGDKVIVTGNQFPTSVSDCLSHGDGQKDGHKYLLQINGEDMELIPTWSVKAEKGGYVEIDWDELQDASAYTAGFVRISGKALAEQSADVIRVISRFRQQSSAFVVTNAVKVDMVEGIDIADSVEDIRSVNVIDLLMEQLEEPEQIVVRALLAEAT